MNWFWRKDNTGATAVADSPAAPPAPRRWLWLRIDMARLFGRREMAPGAEAPTTAALAGNPAVTAPAVPRSAARSAWRRSCDGLSAALGAVDAAMNVIAVPFGVHIHAPRRRYAVLLGVFACLFAVGALPVPYLPLLALATAYAGVLAIGRAWVANEHQRAAIVKKLKHGDPDALPDLRGAALLSALQLLVLFPLTFMQIHRDFGLFEVSPSANFFDWVWFSLDKTYLKALPDWSMLYGVHISSIDFAGPYGRHLVLLSRLTFDYILLQGIYRLLAIRTTIREAVAVVQTDPDVAVRVGRRAIPALVDRLSDPDRAVRGAAANAITQLGDPEGMRLMREALADDPPV